MHFLIRGRYNFKDLTHTFTIKNVTQIDDRKLYIRVHPVFLHSTRAKEKTKNSDSSSSLEKIEFEARNITDFLKIIMIKMKTV